MSLAESKTITPSLPRALPKAAKVKVHNAIEAFQDAIAALVECLDATDDDPDLEDGADDEPSLGGGEGGDDREGDGSDDEPSLAHTNDVDQTRAERHLVSVNGRHATPWHTMDADLEADHDGWEPSLGSVAVTGNQTGWAAGGGGDREFSVDDEGEAE